MKARHPIILVSIVSVYYSISSGYFDLHSINQHKATQMTTSVACQTNARWPIWLNFYTDCNYNVGQAISNVHGGIHQNEIIKRLREFRGIFSRPILFVIDLWFSLYFKKTCSKTTLTSLSEKFPFRARLPSKLSTIIICMIPPNPNKDSKQIPLRAFLEN